MKALVLKAINDLVYEEVGIEELKEDEVLVKIKASGVCGSDVQRVFEKGTYSFPTIPGHEFSGVIEKVYSDKDNDLLNKRVAIFPLLPCFCCDNCEKKEYAQCVKYDYYGSRRDGGFAEYLAVKKWNLVFLPNDVSFEEGAMAEPCAVALHALGQAGIKKDDTLAIFGAGTIGLILAKTAKILGAAKVILVDIDDKKLDFAKKLGFSFTINSMTENTEEKLLDFTEGRGADVVIEGTGVAAALENCIKAAKAFATIVLMGNPLKDMPLQKNVYWDILRKQLTLKGTWNSSFSEEKNDWKRAVELMKDIKPGELITHRYPLSAGAEAVKKLTDRSDMAFKIMYII